MDGSKFTSRSVEVINAANTAALVSGAYLVFIVPASAR